MLRTIEATNPGHAPLTLADVAVFYNDAHGAGAPADTVIYAEATIGGKLKKLTARWDIEGALAGELELAHR